MKNRYLLLGLFAIFASTSYAADWPTWRADANRSAATTEQLPAELHLQWTRQLPALVPAWPEDPRTQFDASYEPIVVGRLMVVASSHNNSVTAYDTRTGEQVWIFEVESPVRFAPVASDGRLYFGADDGRFYCLLLRDGGLLWQFDAAPSIRKVLGNDRLISVWPMRGGPVLANGKIHFTVGVWPFEGVFLYTLDLKSGGPIDEVPAKRILTLRDTTPQGYLAASKSRLYLPCGRSVAACVDLEKHQLAAPFSYNTHGVSTVHVSAIGRWLFHGNLSYDSQERAELNFSAFHPVFTPDAVYFGDKGDIAAYDLRSPKIVETKDRKGRPQKKAELQQLWRLPNAEIRTVPTADFKKWVVDHPLEVHIKAGNRIYAHQEQDLFAVDLPSDGKKPVVSWKTNFDGILSSMLAADGRLFVVSREGRISCYGNEKVDPRVIPLVRKPRDDGSTQDPKVGLAARQRAAEILKLAGQHEGFAFVLGFPSDELIDELAKQTKLRVVIVYEDESAMADMRVRLDERGVHGHQFSVITGDPLNCGLPPYLPNLIICEDPKSLVSKNQKDFERKVFEMLRPYGGKACFVLSQSEHTAFAATVDQAKLANAEIQRVGNITILTRVGALPGSADWTHEFGDTANTLMSQDTLVEAPLGVLWFGGPSGSGELFYNRHEWPPSMCVIGGRMFIQGPGKLSAVDVYTGRVLWKTAIQENEKDNLGRRGNDFENKLAGFHFLAVEDGVYLVDGRKGCLRFDPATGKQLSRYTLPDAEADWGAIRVKGDLLITEVFRTIEKEKKVVADEKLPVELIAMNRHTGTVVWSKKAELSFPVVAISDDKIFCFDGALEQFYRDAKRKGLVPKASDKKYLTALDVKTGKELWKYSTDAVTTWANYSGKNDVLMVSNRDGMAAYRGKDGKEMWKKYSRGQGFKGHPENLWDKIIVWNDWVIDQRGPGGAYHIQTGDPVKRANPITGKSINWEFTKTGHHCNYAVASPHLLTFRAAEAGFCDISSGETSRLGGFRSGCRNSLIPANGVLNAPNFAHGCVCGFSLFTSLALTHLPESEVWSYNAVTVKPEEDAVERIGINFGAPGDHLASNGTLWIDYPNVSGPSPAVSTTLTPDKPHWFQQHSSLVEGDELKWVAASGFEGDGTVVIALNAKATTERAYTVRMHFLEPEQRHVGERVFDVSLQDKTLLKNFDVVAEAGKPLRAVVKEFKGVRATRDLKIELKASSGKSILCGVEIVAE